MPPGGVPPRDGNGNGNGGAGALPLPQAGAGAGPQPPPANATTDKQVMSKMLKVEAKLFYLDLKENPWGRYLKITEKSYGQRSTIIVPEQGVRWFVDMFTYYARG